ncbi:MAG: calcium/sodium antiporter [Planctomycetaceae bacterium]|nr:calcium/sodium antiporter [Planctomycetaceae bacterium]
MWTVFIIVTGLVALVAGAELLVRGASHIAAFWGVSPLIVGLTVVAFGTSAPEMAVSVAATLEGRADIAVGNVVGSNVFNVLLILGLSAVVIPLKVNQKLVRFDVPLMIAASISMSLMGQDGTISRMEGGLLFSGLFAYTAWCILVGNRESADICEEYGEAFGEKTAASSKAGTKRGGNLFCQFLWIIGGLVLLVFGARWLVDGATTVARGLGVSELVIGLTIVAGGTSLPELATSIIAAIRGERDIAVGNVVGSNLFNILGVLGLAALAGPNGVPVAGQTLSFDIPVMVIVAAACLPIFFTGHQISRLEGSLFLGYYFAYTSALILMATSSSLLPQFEQAILLIVIPMTIVIVMIEKYRSVG